MKTTSPAAVPAATAAAASKVLAEKQESPDLRWAFVGRVYAMLSLQLVLAAAFAATAWLVPAVPRFFAHGPRAAVWPTSVAVLASPLIVMSSMLELREREENLKQKHPRNLALFALSKLVLVALFTLCCSFSIAVSAFSATVVVSAASSTDGGIVHLA